MAKKEKIITKDWTYIGEVKGGMPHGRGKLETPSKDWTYIGEVKKGMPHGRGKLETSSVDGAIDIYVGEFKKGKLHGKGTLTENVGGQYEGYQQNLKHIGLWKNGKSIKGKSIYKDGTKYVGDWMDENLAHGKGKITYPNGSQFIGSFYEDDPKVGEGIIYFDNSKYVGEMKTKEGRLNLDGKGVETLKNGDKIEGVWKNGRPIKVSKYVFYGPDDTKWEYEGEVTTKGELLPNGKGVLKIINSKNKYFCIESGSFKKQSLDGKGVRVYYFSKSFKKFYCVLKGEFKNGKLNGKGYENRYIGGKEGSIKYEGIFKNDKLVKGKTTKY